MRLSLHMELAAASPLGVWYAGLRSPLQIQAPHCTKFLQKQALPILPGPRFTLRTEHFVG
jgi:hypothetical protein